MSRPLGRHRLRHELDAPARGRGADGEHDRRPAHAHHPARRGRRPHGRARPRGHRAHARRAPRVPRHAIDRHGVERVRMAATSAARDATEPRRLLRRRPRRSSAPRPSCSAATRRAGSRSPARPPSSTRPTARSSSSTSAAARPSSPYGAGGGDRPTAVDLDRHRLRARHREVPRTTIRPRPRSCSALSVVRRLPRRRRARAPRGRRGADARRPGRHGDDGRGRRDRAARVRPRSHPPLRAHRARRPRTCSARWPPSRAPSGVHNPGLEEARADVIVGGAAVLVAIMRYFELRRVPRQRVRHPRRPHPEPALMSSGSGSAWRMPRCCTARVKAT